MKARKPVFVKAQVNAIVLILCTLKLLAGCATATEGVEHSDSLDGLFSLSAEADQAYSESRWLDAASAYQLLSELVPQDPYAWFRLGNVYARQGLFNEAANAYQSSIKRDSAPPKPWYNLATTHLLNAQYALRQSYARLKTGDPARQLIVQQLVALSAVVYQRRDNGLAIGKVLPE